AWVCALRPGAVTDLTLPLRLARQGEDLNTIGTLLYRAGRYREAAATLHDHMGSTDNSYDCLGLAMAHYRLGQVVAARAWLARAERSMVVHEKPGRGRPGPARLTW